MIASNKTHQTETLRFYGDEFVFNTTSGMFYRITSSAGFLLHHLIKGVDDDQLVTLFQEHYDIDRATAIQDVELLLNNLTELGVIV